MRLRLPRAQARPTDKILAYPWLILAAVAIAAAELVLGFLAGFFDGGRAEPLVFLAFRPWLLLAAAWAAAPLPLRQRALLSGLALGLAASSEAVLLLVLHAPPGGVWKWTWQGLVAGGMLALVLDFAFDCGRNFLGAKSRIAIGLPLLAIYLLPGGLKGYDALALGQEHPGPKPGPHLLLMTGLPIIWGEKGAFDPGSKPAQAYRLLQQQFDVQPLDTIDPVALQGRRLLLLAQPRALTPVELVTLDHWVRWGGRLLILDDPVLAWPSELPLGDLRRPSPVGLLSPLLDHWGVSVSPPAVRRPIVADVEEGKTRRRLFLSAPGQINLQTPDCRLSKPWLARCRIGQGEAVILADADLLRDDLWAGAGEQGAGRHQRLSDNAVFVADLLDGLAALDRSEQRGRVDWLPAVPDQSTAMLAALLPLLAAAIAAAVLRQRS